MAQLTDEEVKLVFKMIDSGEEDKSVLDELEIASRDDADYVLDIMRGIVGESDIQLSGVTPKEYVPKPIKYNLDDPKELAQAISTKEGVPYMDAYQRVASSPRSERARYAGSSFSPLSAISDGVTATFRGLAGLSSVFTGEDPIERMAKPVSDDENPYTGFVGNMLNDPLTYTPSGVSKGALKLGGQALANSSNLVRGAKEGLVTGLGEFGLTQAQQEEEGKESLGIQDAGIQTGISTVLGGGIGKFADKIASKQALEEMPSVLMKGNEAIPEKGINIDYTGEGKDEILADGISGGMKIDPTIHRDRILLDVQKGTGFSKNQAESLPTYVRKEFANIDEEGKQYLNQYMAQAQTAVSDLNAPTPYDQVGQMFVRGKEAIQKAKQEAGSKMGEIESQYLSNENPDGSFMSGAISTDKMKSDWAELLEKHGGWIREEGADGVTYKPSSKIAPVEGAFYQEFIDADRMINRMDGFVTGEYLRSIEKRLSTLTKSAGAGRNGVMNTEADMAVNQMIKQSRDLVGEQIKLNGGEEAFNAYNQAKKDYGVHWTAEDFIDRRLGKSIVAGKDDEFTTRGASMVQGMMRNEDRNSKGLARMIKGLTGEDIGKHAVFAKFAMQSAKDKRGGGGWSPSDGSITKRIFDWGYNKANPYKQIPQDFEGMAKMVNNTIPTSQQTPSILEQAGTNPYIQTIGDIFDEFGQKGLRSGGRGMFSGEQDNKVTSNSLNKEAKSMLDSANIGND